MWYLSFFLLLLPPVFSLNCPIGYSSCGPTKCFMAVNQNKTWPMAQRHCSESGGNLAVITSVMQNDCVNGLAGGYHRAFWIGLIQIGDSGWTWIDGSEMSFTKWKDDEKEKDYQFAAFSPDTGNWKAEKSGVVFPRYFICSAVPARCDNYEE